MDSAAVNEENNTHMKLYNSTRVMIERDGEWKISHCFRFERWTLRYCSHHRMVSDTCSKCLLMKVHLICTLKSIIHRKWWLTLFQCKYLLWLWTLTKQTSCIDFVKCDDIHPLNNGNLNLQFHSSNTKSIVLIHVSLCRKWTELNVVQFNRFHFVPNFVFWVKSLVSTNCVQSHSICVMPKIVGCSGSLVIRPVFWKKLSAPIKCAVNHFNVVTDFSTWTKCCDLFEKKKCREWEKTHVSGV